MGVAYVEIMLGSFPLVSGGKSKILADVIKFLIKSWWTIYKFNDKIKI